MELIIQPDDGVAPLLAGIRGATQSIQLAVFRFDQREIEEALKEAVTRGVTVSALIAHTNNGGGHGLRKLEARLLAGGVTVARTADDLARYHDKLMIIDRRILYVLAFNFTHLDIRHSRSFGILTEEREVVQEAIRLFEADATRQIYTPGLDAFVVSPLNARAQLAAFIKGARRQLLIYDNQISDRQMMYLLEDRAKAGVEIRILGRLGKRKTELSARKLRGARLHTRAMIRDGEQVFIGSQSLRKVELDSRREVGIVVNDPEIARGLLATFEADWLSASGEPDEPETEEGVELPAVGNEEKAATPLPRPEVYGLRANESFPVQLREGW